MFQRTTVQSRHLFRATVHSRVFRCLSVKSSAKIPSGEALKDARSREAPRFLDASSALGTGSTMEALPELEGLINTKVKGYADGGFIVADAFWKSSIVAMREMNVMWKPSSLSAKELKIEDFTLLNILRPKPELILLGTGKRLVLPPKEVLDYLRSIAKIEVMDSVHAIATHNLLLQEDRDVVSVVLELE